MFARKLLCSLLLVFTCAALGQNAIKYVGESEDDPVALFLEATSSGLRGALLLEYGLLLPFEGILEGDRFSGQLDVDPPTTISGQREGERLRLTISSADQLQEFLLMPQTGDVAWAQTPLLRMLALVPDTPAARLGSPNVQYLDLNALERAAAVGSPRTAAAFAELDAHSRSEYLLAFTRAASDPGGHLQFAEQRIEMLPGLLGFEWFDVERSLHFGTPPAETLILAVEPLPADLDSRLRQRGFATSESHGATVWHKGEEGEIAPAEREPGDPFDGALGKPQRISLLQGHLVNAPFWPLLESVAATAAAGLPSLAQAADYVTLAQVAEDPATGELLQAVYLNSADVGLMPADPLMAMNPEIEELATLAERFGPLPFYGLVLLADKQLVGEQLSIVALLYEQAQDADQAASVLTRRLSAYTAVVAPEAIFTVDAPRTYSSESGLFAAVATVRTPTGGPAVYRNWISALMVREFTVLNMAGGR